MEWLSPWHFDFASREGSEMPNDAAEQVGVRYENEQY
jgi:hypothetical protein